MAETNGKDYRALRRLTTFDGRVIAEIGDTCERVPAGKNGGTVGDALARLLASGKIAPIEQVEAAVESASDTKAPAEPAPRRGGRS